MGTVLWESLVPSLRERRGNPVDSSLTSRDGERCEDGWQEKFASRGFSDRLNLARRRGGLFAVFTGIQ